MQVSSLGVSICTFLCMKYIILISSFVQLWGTHSPISFIDCLSISFLSSCFHTVILILISYAIDCYHVRSGSTICFFVLLSFRFVWFLCWHVSLICVCCVW
jgi:hypothetical protein